MCTLCFERVEQDGLFVDNDGVRWDVCRECGMVEGRNRMSFPAYRLIRAHYEKDEEQWQRAVESTVEALQKQGHDHLAKELQKAISKRGGKR